MALDRAQRNDIAHHYVHRGHQWYARCCIAQQPQIYCPPIPKRYLAAHVLNFGTM